MERESLNKPKKKKKAASRKKKIEKGGGIKTGKSWPFYHFAGVGMGSDNDTVVITLNDENKLMITPTQEGIKILSLRLGGRIATLQTGATNVVEIQVLGGNKDEK